MSVIDCEHRRGKECEEDANCTGNWVSGKKAEKFIRTHGERVIVIDYHNWWCQLFNARDTPVAYIYLTLIRSHSQSTLTDWLTHFDENAENSPGVKINRIFCRKAKVQNPISRSLFPPYFLSSPQCRRVVNTPLNLNTHTKHGGESVCMWAVIFHTRPLPGRAFGVREFSGGKIVASTTSIIQQ